MSPTPEDELHDKAKEASDVVETAAANAAAALQHLAEEDAVALRELASEEAAGLVTAASLAEGQREIADGIRDARTRETILMFLFLIFIAVYGIWSFSNGNAVREVHAQVRREAQSECVQFNVQQQFRRDGNVHLLDEALRFLLGARLDEVREAEFVAKMRLIAKQTWPYRDCSEHGIDEYLKNPPVDPATEGGG